MLANTLKRSFAQQRNVLSNAVKRTAVPATYRTFTKHAIQQQQAASKVEPTLTPSEGIISLILIF